MSRNATVTERTEYAVLSPLGIILDYQGQVPAHSGHVEKWHPDRQDAAAVRNRINERLMAAGMDALGAEDGGHAVIERRITTVVHAWTRGEW